MKKSKTKSAPKVQYKTYTRTTFEFSDGSDVYKYLLKEVKKNEHLTIVIENESRNKLSYNETILDSHSIDRIRYLTSDGNCLWTPNRRFPSERVYLNNWYNVSCFVEDFTESKGKKPTIIQTIKKMEEFDKRYGLIINHISLDKGKTWINIEVI